MVKMVYAASAASSSIPHDLCFRSHVHHGNGFRCGGGCKIVSTSAVHPKKTATATTAKRCVIIINDSSNSANTRRNIEQFINTLTETERKGERVGEREFATRCCQMSFLPTRFVFIYLYFVAGARCVFTVH